MDKPKRILFFSLTYHPYIGGAEVAIKEVTDRISEGEYSFDMITLRFDSALPRFERFGNIDIFRIGFTSNKPAISDFKKFPLVMNKYLYPFMALIAAAVLHKRKPYDAVMTVMTSYASFAALFFKSLFPKVPYIARADDGDPFPYYERRARITGPLFRWLFTKSDFLVVTSTYLLSTVRSLGYKGQAEIVPNGVNSKHFSKTYAADELLETRQSFGFEKGSTILITTSRLVKKNAVDDVIRALPLLPGKVKFVVGGIGPDLEMLQKLAREKGVSDRVRFLGQINHAEMPKYLKSSDVFIRPSLSEGFGISFIEAFAAGLPVIATQEGGIADFLFDEKRNPDKQTTGWAVDKNSPEQIAETVRDIMAKPDKVKGVVANAKKLAFEKYDWDLIARDMKNKVFDKLFQK